MNEAVIVVATFTPKDGHLSALLEGLRGTVPAIHAEPGCQLYAVHEAVDGTVVQIEKWSSRDLLDQHSAGPAVAALKLAIAPHLAKPQVLAVMSAVPIGHLSQGSI